MKSLLIITLGVLVGLTIQAQEVLSLENAVSEALSKNHNIQLVNKQKQVLDNTATIGNAGMLPKVDASAGVNMSNSQADLEFANGIPPIEDATSESTSLNAGISVSYNLFDGLGSFYTYQKLKEQSSLGGIQSRLTIESTLYQVMSIYYQGVNLQTQVRIAKESVGISKDRLKRVEASFEYGKSNSLDVLNAKVDLNNDSLNLLNLEHNLTVVKRNLNLLTQRGEDVSYSFREDFEVNQLLLLEDLQKLTTENNVNILLAKSSISTAEIDKKIQQSFIMPRLIVSGNYGYNYSESNTGLILNQNSLGLTGSVTFAWNLFDGGKKSTQLKNAQIMIESSQIEYDQALQTVKNDFNIARDNYLKESSLYKLSLSNEQVAASNLERTKEMYYQGLISSVQFREAQLNYNRAQSQLITSKINLKLSEIELNRLAGKLIS